MNGGEKDTLFPRDVDDAEMPEMGLFSTLFLNADTEQAKWRVTPPPGCDSLIVIPPAPAILYPGRGGGVGIS